MGNCKKTCLYCTWYVWSDPQAAHICQKQVDPPATPCDGWRSNKWWKYSTEGSKETDD